MISVPVIAAGELDDQITASECACHPDCAHHRLGSRGYEANLLQTRVRCDDTLRQLNFRGTGRTEGRAIPSCLGNRRHNCRMRMAENQSAPGCHEIQGAAAWRVD